MQIAEVYEINGTVSKILFFDSNSNFTVAVISSKQTPQFAKNPYYKDSFTAVGNFMRIEKGQQLSLKGRWERSPRYGWQFVVDEYKEVLPASEDALVEYLSSKLFKGIGTKLARDIVKTFGKDTLYIIKYNPDKLTEVKGISEARKEALIKSYWQYEHLEKLMLMLKPYGVTNKKIIKIYNTYGEKAVEILNTNPYKLVEDIHGFGFKTADQIARACHISIKSPFRIRAATFHVLKDAATAEGHVFLSKRSLMMRLSELLGTANEDVNKEDIDPVLEEMVQKQEIICEENDYYLPFYYTAEKAVASKIDKLLKIKPQLIGFGIEEAINKQEEKFGIKYAFEQRCALENIFKSNLLIITGGPGTGKTTIIKGIIGIYQDYLPQKKIVLTAPTGRAAKRMEEVTGLEAKTIHRLLEFKPIDNSGFYCLRNETNPIEADLLIIDECSMIDLLLMNHLLKAVPPQTQIVFVGDADQLPSIGAGNVFRDMIASGKIPTVRLNKIFRQANTSRIVINANYINNGRFNLVLGDDFEFIEEDDNTMLPKLIEEKLREELKNGNLARVQVLSPFKTRTSTGVNNLNAMLQEVFNPRKSNSREIHFGKKIFRENDKVIQLHNDYIKEVFNGDIGIIEKIDEDEEGMFAEIDFDGRKVVYREDDFEDLDLAYSITIHKSQGSEYDIVIMPVTTQHYLFLQRNMLYTAVTRAKKKVILIGSKRALIIAVKTNRVVERNSKLAQRI